MQAGDARPVIVPFKLLGQAKAADAVESGPGRDTHMLSSYIMPPRKEEERKFYCISFSAYDSGTMWCII